MSYFLVVADPDLGCPTAVKNVGEPCAGEPHARFDGRELETECISVTAPAPDPTILRARADEWIYPKKDRVRREYVKRAVTLNALYRAAATALED